jgi:outer membrane protein assembly factor BamB
MKKSIRGQLNSVKWKINLGELGREDAAFAAPIVSDDYLIIDNCSNTLYCLNKRTGDILWTFKSDRYTIVDIIITQQKLVCFKDMDDIYYCIKLETGKLIEKIMDEKIFSEKYQLRNFEIITDKIQIDYDSVLINDKHFKTDFMAYDPEIIFGQKRIIGDLNPTGEGCNLYCIDTITHNLLWKIQNMYINTKAVISQHNAYFGTSNKLCSINEDGIIKYYLTIPTEDGAVGIPSIENGIAYFGCYSGDIYCITL